MEGDNKMPSQEVVVNEYVEAINKELSFLNKEYTAIRAKLREPRLLLLAEKKRGKDFMASIPEKVSSWSLYSKLYDLKYKKINAESLSYYQKALLNSESLYQNYLDETAKLDPNLFSGKNAPDEFVKIVMSNRKNIIDVFQHIHECKINIEGVEDELGADKEKSSEDFQQEMTAIEQKIKELEEIEEKKRNEIPRK